MMGPKQTERLSFDTETSSQAPGIMERTFRGIGLGFDHLVASVRSRALLVATLSVGSLSLLGCKSEDTHRQAPYPASHPSSREFLPTTEYAVTPVSHTASCAAPGIFPGDSYKAFSTELPIPSAPSNAQTRAIDARPDKRPYEVVLPIPDKPGAVFVVPPPPTPLSGESIHDGPALLPVLP